MLLIREYYSPPEENGVFDRIFSIDKPIIKYPEQMFRPEIIKIIANINDFPKKSL